jgi:endonuclease/exonuclease/phosphatase family protein
MSRILPMRKGLIFLLVLICVAGCAKTVRFATFNASLNRDKPGQLLHDLSSKDDQQIKNVAEIIQRVNPDVLLINEFDYDRAGRTVHLFQKNYLAVSQNGARPIRFRYSFLAPVNTGIASGRDLDNDGKVENTPGTRAYGGDALGFGLFPGQYGVVLLSKYPIDREHARTFQRFKWKDMPGAILPVDAKGKPWYTDDELSVFRLSSKSHWDVSIKIDKQEIRILASHPTPPAFDGPEHRNGKRNHDEIRLWADYIAGGNKASYIYDDAGEHGREDKDFPFVVMGDENADPIDGQSVPGAIQQLLENPRVNSSFTPSSIGAPEAAKREAGTNANQKGDAKFDTADFPDTGGGPGNLRCDYVLPSRDLKVIGSGVFWPPTSDPLSRLVQMSPKAASSDHRLVYIDVKTK